MRTGQEPLPLKAADQDALRRAVEEALVIAEQEEHVLKDLRAALESGDDVRALVLARRICGLPAAEPDPGSTVTHQSGARPDASP